jgi:SAM-dependent methyltransferase
MNEHSHHDDHGHDGVGMAELLSLDADVLHAYHTQVFDWIGEIGGDPATIVDLGSGIGIGAVALAERFPGAAVIALDMSEEMLADLRERTAAAGVADRVRAVPVDLDTGWPDLGRVDLLWASNSMHHMGDPDRVLAAIFDALNPGGVLAIAEMDSFPRFVPDEIEARAHQIRSDAAAAELPHLGSDWRSRLKSAGFTIESERHFEIDLTPPLPQATGRYAQQSLRLLRGHLGGRMDAADLHALDALVETIPSRPDLGLRTARTVWVARRP